MQRRQFLICISVAASAPASRSLPAQEDASPGAQQWQSVFERMFPHRTVEPLLYRIPADALLMAAEKDPATSKLLTRGWHQLNRACRGDWMHAGALKQTAALQSVQRTPLFSLLRRTVVYTLYSNPRVWSACGYEGDAWVRGGYAGPGLMTIDWLPSPAPQSPHRPPS